jgi:hypothetical protein
MKLTGKAAETAGLFLYGCEGPIFSIIFAITLRGLGRFTKDGSALLAAAIGGGGVFPPILSGIAGGNPANIASGYRVMAAAFAIGTLYPLYLNLFPLARKMADPVKERALLAGSIVDSNRRPSNASARPSTGIEIIHGPKLNVPQLAIPTPPHATTTPSRTEG